MSGDEVENMEQEELADCVGKVGSSRGGLAAGRRERFSSKFTDSALLCPCTQVSVFFRTSPKHKLKIIKVSWEPRGSVRASPGRWRGLCSGWSRARAAGSLGRPQTGVGAQGHLGHVHRKQEPERGGAEGERKSSWPVSRVIFGVILVSYLQASVSPSVNGGEGSMNVISW